MILSDAISTESWLRWNGAAWDSRQCGYGSSPFITARWQVSTDKFMEPLNNGIKAWNLFSSRSIRRSTFPIQHDLIISANRQTQNLLDESTDKTEPKSGIKSEAFENYKRRNIYTSCSPNTNCPPHIYRHDGEFGRDRYSNSLSQVRKKYQSI